MKGEGECPCKSMIKITEEEYDLIEETTSQIPYSSMKVNVFPSIEDIKLHIEPHFEEFIPFIVWILNWNKELTPNEKEARKYLQNLTYANLEIGE